MGHRKSFVSALLTLLCSTACGGAGDQDPAGSDTPSGTGGAAGADGAGSPDAGTTGGSEGSGGGATTGTGGSGPQPQSFCERWALLAAGDLPGFATDSECRDYTDITTDDVPCSGAENASASIERVEIAQMHVVTPTTEDFTHNEGGEELEAGAVRPKFRLISHRPAMLFVAVNGSGAAPEVKVTASRNGSPIGSLCLKGPGTLSASAADEPGFEDRFTVSMPESWIRTGLELEISAGEATRQIPATELRVAGGLRHMVVEVPMLLYGETAPSFVPKDSPDVYVMADELPVQSLIWSHFPVPVVLDPVTMSGRSGNPPRVLTERESSFDEVGECLDIASEIRRANGHIRETSYYASLKSGQDGWNGGLGGGNGAAGPATQLMIRHEGGHAYGLPHMEDAYRQQRYPFAKRTDGSGCVLGVPGEDGCGVGPYYKYFQSLRSFESPWREGSTIEYLRDPMAGGGNNWFGAYTVQWVLDYMQGRSFWDDQQEIYVTYDAESGEFVEDDAPQNDNWYERPAERDVPVYTIFGSYSDSVSAVNVIQKPLHYRGNLLKIMDPTAGEELQWLKDNSGDVCGRGCDFVVRATFDGSLMRTYLLNKSRGEFVRWAINIPDEGRLTKAELYLRPLNNSGGGNAGSADASTYLDGATLVAEREY